MREVVLFAIVLLLSIGSVSAEDPGWVPGELVEQTVGKLVAGMPKGGAATLRSIEGRFSPAPSSAAQLAIQIDALTTRLGGPKRFDVVGIQSVNSSERIFRVGVLVYHEKAPSFWDLVFFRPGDQWVILELSFTTEDVLQKAIALAGDG